MLRQPLVVALPPGHALATRPYVPLHALAPEPFVMVERELEPGFVDAIVNACRKTGFDPHVAHEVDCLHSACALVAAGLGVCFVPEGFQDPSVVLRPIEAPLPYVESHLAVAYRREPLCDLVRLFVAVARDVAAGRTAES